MNPNRRSTFRLLLAGAAALLALPLGGHAEEAARAADAGRGAEMTDAEVRKVDREAGKVTLKHGEIRNLGMPPMTMVFTATDKAMLDKLQPGDKVRFRADKTGGKYMLIEIVPAP